MKAITLILKGRPRSTKNSRQIVRVRGKPRSVMSDAAAAWIATARLEVRRQWKGRPLQHPVHLHVHAVFANRRSLMDADNIVQAIFDAIKGIVVCDDDLRCLPSHSFSHEVTPGAPEGVVLTLTLPEVL